MKAAKDYVGDGFRIEYRWKEEVVYWEGDRGFLFDAGWGVEPSVLYVPSPEIWQDVMPDWLRDRRSVVVQRLQQHSEHVLMDDVHGHYRRDPESRVQSEPASEQVPFREGIRTLRDGRTIGGVELAGGSEVIRVRGHYDVPFDAADVVDVEDDSKRV